MPQDDLIDVVDEEDKVIYQITRKEAINKKLAYRAIHIFLFNSKGELFLQKRASTKKRYPDYYDSSVSGHLNANESYEEAAYRELKGELGILNVSLDKQFKIKCIYEGFPKMITLFILKYDGEIKINSKEISAGRFYSVEEIKNMIRTNKFTPSFIQLFEEYLRSKNLKI